MAFHQYHVILWVTSFPNSWLPGDWQGSFPTFSLLTTFMIPQPITLLLLSQWVLCRELHPLRYLLVRGPTKGLTRSCIKAFEANRTPTLKFSSSRNSVPCKQLFCCAGMAPVTGGGMVPALSSVHAVPLGALSSIAMVLLSKKEKMVEKAGEVRTCWEIVVRPRYRGALISLNSVAYRKLGIMGTENQEGQVMRAKHTF